MSRQRCTQTWAAGTAPSSPTVGGCTTSGSPPQKAEATFDGLSRQLTEVTTLGATSYTVSYQYDAAGRRTRLTWPGSYYVDYIYNTGGDLTQIRENGATSAPGLLATYAYDDLGRRTLLTRGNGVTTDWNFDDAGRLTGLVHDLASTGNDQSFGFSYTPASQLLTRTRSNAAYDWTEAGSATSTRSASPIANPSSDLQGRACAPRPISSTDRRHAPITGHAQASTTILPRQIGTLQLGINVFRDGVMSGIAPRRRARRFVYSIVGATTFVLGVGFSVYAAQDQLCDGGLSDLCGALRIANRPTFDERVVWEGRVRGDCSVLQTFAAMPGHHYQSMAVDLLSVRESRRADEFSPEDRVIESFVGLAARVPDEASACADALSRANAKAQMQCSRIADDESGRFEGVEISHYDSDAYPYDDGTFDCRLDYTAVCHLQTRPLRPYCP